MTDRELATVLAALRNLQYRFRPPYCCGDHDDASRLRYIKSCFPEHFADCDPLSEAEIDALCEKLNAPEPKAPQWHIMPDDEADPALNLFRIRGEANRHVASRMSCEDAERIVRLANEKVTVGLFIEGGLLVGIRSNTPNIEHLVWYHDKGREPDPDEDECEAENKAAYEALPHGIY